MGRNKNEIHNLNFPLAGVIFKTGSIEASM